MLKGKTALVTGASNGIGRAIAMAMAAQGAKVIVNYHGSRECAEEVVKTILDLGQEAVAYQCDVADFEKCRMMIEHFAGEFGAIDILVNNAGITKDNLIMKMTEEEFDQVIQTNLKGTFNTIKHISRLFLKQRSGKIINISSVSGVMGNAGQANYSASKAGIIGLTKSVARELASRGICVNAIAPGYIETKMSEAVPEAAKQELLKQIPLKRMGQAEEVAHMAVFLASEKADYITGQVIHIDGGMSM